MTRLTRWQRVVAVVVAVALVLGAGAAVALPLLSGPGDDGAGGSAYALPEAADGATEPPSPELARFYDQRLSFEECESFWCSRLTVPVDYAEPDGETIDLAVLVAPATGERRGTLVVNPGGPGAPGTTFAAMADQALPDRIRESFDVVGLDPRGTGSSEPVDCLSDSDLDAYFAADPSPDTSAEQRETVAWSQRFAAGCAQGAGKLADHVSTVEAARDMDVLRAALGDDALDYYGASYGTKLGATYADLFPDRTGRLVLDGGVDVNGSARTLALEQAAGFETALRAYAADCLAANDCPLSGTVDQALQQIRGVVEQVDARPMSTDGRWLQAGNAFYGLLTPLYSRDTWPMLTSALRAVIEEKNGSQLLLLADAYASRVGGTYLDNSAEAIMAINCLDDPWALTPEQVPAQMAAFTKASPTFGDAFAWSMTGCLGWQQQAGAKAADGERVDAAGAPPIVVVGTTRDPATPYAWSQRLARDLASGVLVTRDGDGHTGLNAGNDCVDTAVADYLVDGTVPADGLTC